MAETVRKVCNICRFCLSQNEEHLVPLAIIIDDTFTIQDVEQFTGVQDLESGNTTYMVCNYCDDILSNLCRFCLNRDEDLLLPLSVITDASFTVQDVEQFTGIQDLSDESQTYVVCNDCDNKLRKSVSFRNACIKNDAHFRELCLDVAESPETEWCDDPASNLQPEESVSSFEFVEVNNRRKRNVKGTRKDDGKDKESLQDVQLDQLEETLNTRGIENDDHLRYSANNISLGQPFSSGDEQNESQTKLRNRAIITENLRRLRTSHTQQMEDEQTATNVADESDSNNGPQKSWKATKHQQLCDICGKLVHQINAHMPFHTKEAVHACPHCPVRMTNHGNLYRHVQAVHLKRVIKTCELCDKGFTSKGSYRSHMRARHGIGETYDCKLCSKSFNHPGNYRVHFMRCHSDERKFTCATCGKQFKEKRDHRNHQRVHSDDKPFVCGLCPKSFKSEYAKKTHELTHSGVVFECTVCDKTYRYKCLLSNHMRKDHPTVVAPEMAEATDELAPDMQ
ncbi:PR domain zinc finger protein 5-like [Anopheles nili]|uniref:PR domain zinc finger protein 5-like n=1 Tax=Anopheles nili TaxID=185578 RepID=UPI00237B5F2D|nr:PR domain zinc finger protein 5-like [Anopheles nili]